MSIRVVDLVMRNRDLPPSLKLAAVALAFHADADGGNCYPSLARVAAMTGVSERYTKALVKDMVERGLIRAQRRYRKGGGRTSSAYQWDIDALEVGATIPRASEAKVNPGSSMVGGIGEAQFTNGGTIGEPQFQPLVNPSSPYPSVDPSEEEKNASPSSSACDAEDASQEDDQPAPTAKPKRRPAKPIPPDWQPGPRAVRWIESFGLTVADAKPAIVEFREYWAARSKRRVDWDLCLTRNGRVEAALIRLAKQRKQDRGPTLRIVN
ncbi:MAG: hypothetical protein K9M02_17535 [Thiohalocapsa sp.]|nr:hypothetical protein [Thiohalocapsa sp.]